MSRCVSKVLKKVILVVAVLVLTVVSSGGCLATTKYTIGKSKTLDKVFANILKNCYGKLSSFPEEEGSWYSIYNGGLEELRKATVTGEGQGVFGGGMGGFDWVNIPNIAIDHGDKAKDEYSPDEEGVYDIYGMNMGTLTCGQFVFGNREQDSTGHGGTWGGIVDPGLGFDQQLKQIGFSSDCPEGDLCRITGDTDKDIADAKKRFNIGEEETLQLSQTEVFNVYEYYIGNDDNINMQCDVDSSPGNDWYNVHIWRNKEYTDSCWVSQKSEMNHYLLVEDYGYGYVFGNNYVGLKDLVEEINKLANPSLINQDEVYSIDEMKSTKEIVRDFGGDPNWTGPPFIYNGVGDVCKNSGGSGIFGWFLCPIMTAMGDAATGIYDDFLKPQLEISPTLMGATDENNSAAVTWRIFQNMANIAFSIILLVVIFSQLTGRGIDNYGIKKILPKLVITAMLVNLSFVICQVAVDLSNILGNSLQNLLSNVASENTTVMIVENKTTVAYDTVGTDVMTGVFLAGLFVSGTAGMIAIYRNPALLLALLVGLVGVVVAVFFIFVILAARQAAVLILVVLSPLAFVCYALPNTKKLFDKWLKIMQALLLVYPICGILIGGGNFVSKLLLNSGSAEIGFGMALTAMLTSVVPLFFIPTVLKNSMSALGGLGAKISGLGNKIGGGAKGTLKNTRAYKNAQERGKARGDRKFVQRRVGVHFNERGEVEENRFSLRRRMAGTRFGRAIGMDAAMGENQAKLRSMEEARLKNITAGKLSLEQRTGENGESRPQVTPLVNPKNLKQKMQNTINEVVADNKVPVMPVSVELAQKRRESAVKAQETKNFMDQFVGKSDDELRQIAKSDFIDKFKEAKTDEEREAILEGNKDEASNSVQEMQALIATMASREMDDDIADILDVGGDAVGNNADVMKTLAGVENVSFKAYGKNGEGVSYTDFMRGTNSKGQKLYRDNVTGKITTSDKDENNNNNVAVSMSNYVANKSEEFLDGLDSRALSQIARFQAPEDASAPRVQIISGDMIAKAESVVKTQGATRILDDLMEDGFKHGQKIEFSTAQYMNLNVDTRKRLNRLAVEGNVDIRRNLVRIARTVEASPMLRMNLSGSVQDELKLVRQKWDSGYNNPPASS